MTVLASNWQLVPRTCDVKATEKRRMIADTTDSDSCTQKLIQPSSLVAFEALSSARRATSETGTTGSCMLFSFAALDTKSTYSGHQVKIMLGGLSSTACPP